MEDYEEDDTNEDIKWRTLGPKDRVKFLKNLFSDAEWYDGTPFFEGGDTNPDFQTICDRSGAPMAEVKRYYASWLDRKVSTRREPSSWTSKTMQSPTK